MAHDFNNLLTVIMGYSELLDEQLDRTIPGGKLGRDSRWRASAPRRLTQPLLAFSRKQVLEPRVLDLNDVVSASRRCCAG